MYNFRICSTEYYNLCRGFLSMATVIDIDLRARIKKLELQLALKTSSSQILLAPGGKLHGCLRLCSH